MRPRPAPSAVRSANSLRRVVPRASSRLATLTQAISSRNPTAPISTQSAPTDAAHQLVFQYEDRGPPALIQGGQGAFHLAPDGFQFGAHLFQTSRGGGR